jgi:hypothetical protein
MDSLLSCARAGIGTIGATLFSTTFPCHNCAKHIVAAGIRRVVYIEPYEKSQAIQLHGDAITSDDHGDRGTAGEGDPKKVVFEPFVGIGPRRYFDMFSMKLSDGYPLKRKIAGKVAPWKPNRESVVRVPMLPMSYLEREARTRGHGEAGDHMSTKIKISLEDPEIRKIWEGALKAKREVESWPAWKRGEEVATVASEDVPAPASTTTETKP